MTRALLAAAVFLAALRRFLVVVQVTGDSMRPTYADGDLLLAARVRQAGRGAAVVFRTPRGVRQEGDPPYRVKRVAAVAGDPAPAWLPGHRAGDHVPPARIVVRGDAPRSEDSRHHGYVDAGDVLAVVIGRVGTARRRG